MMADTRMNCINQKSAAASTSRLQRRRPASLQISPASASTWNAAIPLLSPLGSSPTATDRATEIRSPSGGETAGVQQQQQQQPVVYQKWQHPAAPFYQEQPGAGSFGPSFFCPRVNTH